MDPFFSSYPVPLVTNPAHLPNNGVACVACEHETEQSQLDHKGTEPLTLGSLAPFLN